MGACRCEIRLLWTKIRPQSGDGSEAGGAVPHGLGGVDPGGPAARELPRRVARSGVGREAPSPAWRRRAGVARSSHARQPDLRMDGQGARGSRAGVCIMEFSRGGVCTPLPQVVPSPRISPSAPFLEP
ncbi:hypothetical protein PVAP13_9KG585201 [Panicum virgatum]|uniref:Uncharacterized protein n=1 Tax=Panicum virgatum TaxID=38727 RepID=A0A8T0NXZ7_PANVG|nr:hypothetical protein PVAP13_9KG585201 [Panicum virgatum]KAG2554821.1 hypothetical protein PVAP13_9KG585201 [Panicum virgatum]